MHESGQYTLKPITVPTPDLDIPFRKHVLDNGLQVVIHEDRSCPIAAVNVWYHVGSKNEVPGRTGFAHLFEHLMFEGSAHHDSGYFEPLQQAGGTLNGSTYTTESGRVLHMLIARDMSDIYTMMSHIKQAQEQLIHSGRLASLGEMAAGIGHELTQPLNAILLFARNSIHCLNEPTVNKTLLKENLQVIIDRAKKASSIIKSLKSFARKETPNTNPVEINQILTNILQFLDSQLKLSDIERLFGRT